MPYHLDRKSTRLNSSHTIISYAVFCLKKKKGQKSTKTAQLQRHFFASDARRNTRAPRACSLCPRLLLRNCCSFFLFFSCFFLKSRRAPPTPPFPPPPPPSS